MEASCKNSYKGCEAREEARAKRFGTKATRFDPITIAIGGAHGPKMGELLRRMQKLSKRKAASAELYGRNAMKWYKHWMIRISVKLANGIAGKLLAALNNEGSDRRAGWPRPRANPRTLTTQRRQESRKTTTSTPGLHRCSMTPSTMEGGASSELKGENHLRVIGLNEG